MSNRPALGRPPLLLVLPAALAALFLVVPLVALVLETPWRDLATLVRTEAVREALRLTVVTSLATVGVCLVVGTPLAWLLAWAPGAVPVGGSDFHTMDGAERPGLPTTWVAVAEPSVAGILDGLRAGRVAVSAAPDAPVLLRVDGELVAVDADGTLLVDFEGRRRPVRGSVARTALSGPGPYWLEDAKAQVLAISA